ncbi:MAG: hypothetical protein R3E50_14745 [Halioglobus sp.]
MSLRLAMALCAVLALGNFASAVVMAEEQGQYRSRIMLTPEGEWSKGAELTVEELERQLGSIEDAYTKSSAGRHLARHYVERKEYDKAIDFYQQALAAGGLSPVANREMLRELAQVYLLRKDYASAAQSLQQALALDLVADATDYLLLARAQHELKRYVEVVATLDRMQAAGLALDAQQMQQALALYYHAGAFAQCEALLTRLLELQPQEPRHWHLLASVYLQQNKKKQALDQLTLAREKRVPFTEQDILLLASLQSVNDNPYGAAEVLDDALSRGEVPASGTNYRKLFEFWMRAREPQRAQSALQQAARLSGDIQLYLYLAQLQGEQQDFQGMRQTMLAACAAPLPDTVVGRANVLLGISQFKLGDDAGARRSFINATLVGGVNAEAGQWLRFMNAAPTTVEEAGRVAGICHGARDQRLAVADGAPGAAPSEDLPAPASAAPAAVVAIKTVPPQRLYFADYDKPLSELVNSLRASVASLAVSLTKSGGSVDGPLQIHFQGDPGSADTGMTVQLALPFRGAASGSGRFRAKTTAPFKCAYQLIAGSGDELRRGFADLARSVGAAQYELTGEGRLVITESDNSAAPSYELQLGIR